MSRGLFLVIDDRGDRGELVTMFSPDEVHDCLDHQGGEAVN
jgi:hypothetical protein